MKTAVSIIYLIIALILSIFMSRCQSADTTIAAKNLNCNDPTNLDLRLDMACCMQYLSSGTGSDSKDAVCRPIVDELVSFRKVKRKTSMIEFCKKPENQLAKDNGFGWCWDKIQDK